MAALNLNTIRKDIEERLIAEFNKVPPTKIVFGNKMPSYLSESLL